MWSNDQLQSLMSVNSVFPQKITGLYKISFEYLSKVTLSFADTILFIGL